MQQRKELGFFIDPKEVAIWLELINPDFDEFYEIYTVSPLIEIFSNYYQEDYVVGFALKPSLHDRIHQCVSQSPNHVLITSTLINAFREENTSSDLLFSPKKEFGKRVMNTISCQLKRYGRNPEDKKTTEALLAKIAKWQKDYTHNEMYIHLVVLVEGFQVDKKKILDNPPQAFQRIIIFCEDFQKYIFITNKKYLDAPTVGDLSEESV